jgi:hypothetical protein
MSCKDFITDYTMFLSSWAKAYFYQPKNRLLPKVFSFFKPLGKDESYYDKSLALWVLSIVHVHMHKRHM